MSDLKKMAKGVLAFMIGIFFTLVSFYIIPPLIYEMSQFGDATTSLLLKTVFWTGYIILIILAVVYKPAQMIIEAKQNT